MTRNEAGEIGFEVFVGGGLGRTPMIGKVRDFLPKKTCCLSPRQSCASTTCYGRRDNKYKARIKIPCMKPASKI
jgi:sulfite reductase (NADPH) hemoprotein beta-component